MELVPSFFVTKKELSFLYNKERRKYMSTSKKMIKEIKEHVSIVDLASDYFDLTRKNGYFGIRGLGADGGDFSSIVIYPESNSFFRNSNRHGGDVISFVTETQIEGINNFRDAVIFLRQRIDPDFKIETSYKKKKTYAEMSSSERIEKLRSCNEMLKENFSEEVEKTYKHAMAYLIQERKLDPEIVKEGFKNGEIAQVNMKGHKGVAFISKEMGLYSCISKRGISKGSKFKGDYKGCDYDYGWRLFPTEAKKKGFLPPDGKIYCFEGYIDMLSFKTLAKNMIQPDKDIFIVCGSTNKYQCVLNTVNEYRRDVIVCFDNDTKGHELGDVLKEALLETNKSNDRQIKVGQLFSKGKDWNDDLKAMRKQQSIQINKSPAILKSRSM